MKKIVRGLREFFKLIGAVATILSELFKLIGAVATLLLYPIPVFSWYRHCRTKGDGDYRKFLRFSILGAVGIVGLVAMWWVPLPWKGIVALTAVVPYVVGAVGAVNLVQRKKYP